MYLLDTVDTAAQIAQILSRINTKLRVTAMENKILTRVLLLGVDSSCNTGVAQKTHRRPTTATTKMRGLQD
jgi:hypothetical protein